MASAELRKLSYDEFEKWLTQLGLDWPTLLREAELGPSQKHVIKNRWGKNPRQMDKIYAALDRLEDRRINKTDSGARIAALKEWQNVGAVLSMNMPKFLKVLADARAEAAKVEAATTAPLLSITPEPDGKRK